jgi:hypothetical protein
MKDLEYNLIYPELIEMPLRSLAMPLLTITTNISFDDEAAQALCSKASSHVASLLAKPESYVMISLQHGTAMSFAGDASPCAMLELKSLGLPEQQTAEFSESLCDFLKQHAGIPDRHCIGIFLPGNISYQYPRHTSL